MKELIGSGGAAVNETIELELLVGCRTDEEFNLVRRNLAGVNRMQIQRTTWDIADSLGFDLRRKGVTTSVPDLLIAASAIEHDATLLHADRDFDRIAEHSDLRVESYVDAAI